MSFNIVVGPWIVPLVFTIWALAWAIPLREDERDRGGYFGGLAGITAVFRTGATVIACLVAWLVWALLRS